MVMMFHTNHQISSNTDRVGSFAAPASSNLSLRIDLFVKQTMLTKSMFLNKNYYLFFSQTNQALGFASNPKPSFRAGKYPYRTLT
jgi:hypothetical protein